MEHLDLNKQWMRKERPKKQGSASSVHNSNHNGVVRTLVGLS